MDPNDVKDAGTGRHCTRSRTARLLWFGGVLAVIGLSFVLGSIVGPRTLAEPVAVLGFGGAGCRFHHGAARLRVLDRGVGAPEAERERIFEPFYRLAPAGPDAGAAPESDVAAGVGLGLALVRQIAHHHGGETRCLPRDGGGACFEVDLPGF